MKAKLCKTIISIKDYFPKLKKIQYESYDCIISYNKSKQIIPIKNPENKTYQFTTQVTKKDLTFLITIINTENKTIIGKNNLTIASFRLKQLKETKKIKYEQQIKIALNKKMKEKLFGPGINIGNIYLICIIDIAICVNNNMNNISNIFLYKLENNNKYSNIPGNNGIDYNLSNLSLSSFLTNLSTLKENKKSNEKKIKNVSSTNNIKYLYTEIQSKQIKKRPYFPQGNNYSSRKTKILSPIKIISLKKNKTKWHINREYLKSNILQRDVNIKNRIINTSSKIRKVKYNNIINNKLRKAFSNENIINPKPRIQLETEICNNDKTLKSNSKYKNNIIKTERKKQKSVNKYKKLIKKPKTLEKTDLKKSLIIILNNIKEKN